MKIKKTALIEFMARRQESQSSLAKKANVNRQTIGGMLSKGVIPGIDRLARISAVLGVKVEDIVDFTEEKTPIIRNTALLRENIKSKMADLNIQDANSLCRLIGYDKVNTLERLLDGKIAWFPDVLSAVLQVLDIKNPPLSPKEAEILFPAGTFGQHGALLVRPVPVVAWANAASSITAKFTNSGSFVMENWQEQENTETVLIPAGNREISIAFKVRGVSMEPTFFDNDIILVERKMGFSEIPDKKVVVVKFNDDSAKSGVYCKRLRRFGDTLHLTSDNPQGEEFEITPSLLYEIDWIGQVVQMQSSRGL